MIGLVQDKPLATWWCHDQDGDYTYWAEAPRDYTAMTAVTDNFMTEMRKHGYRMHGREVSDTTEFRVGVYLHRDGHLWVEICDTGNIFSTFFVDGKDAVMFWIKCYPTLHATMLRDATVEERARERRKKVAG